MLAHMLRQAGRHGRAAQSQRAVRLQGSPPAGDATAVYIGIQQMEYGSLAAAHLTSLGAFSATGSPFSVAAGRLSFVHGFHGPAVRPRCLARAWTVGSG